MTDKQIIGGRGSAKSYTTLNTIEVMLENEKLKEALKRKEKECEELQKIIDEAKNSKLDLKSFLVGEAVQNEYEQQLDQLKAENKRLKWYMQEIRDEELHFLDIEWDEYETQCNSTEYSNIINLVEEALEERSPEDCRYGK